MVWGETLPSGRERAIEMLIDMEAQGSFYRAARVLEESVPQALLNRPNLVTKAALVEEAHSLSKHELDQLDKYDSVFGESQNASFSDRLLALEPDEKYRILHHHAKITAAKRANKTISATTCTGTSSSTSRQSVAPSPQLVAALRHVYGGEESHVLMSLLQSVMDHPVFSRDEVSGDPEDSEVDDSPPVTYQLESLIARLCHDQESLPGMLISILSLLTALNPAPAIQDPSSPQAKKTTEESDPIPMPALQVGSLLKILRPEEDDKGAWNVDTDLLLYLGEAASAHEERIDIQKSRILIKDQETPSITPLQTPLGPQSSATPDASHAIAINNPDVDEATAALSAAVFEQMISAATGEETSSNDNDNDDENVDNSSDSESNRENSPHDQSARRALENDSSSSSSSSSSSDAEPEDTHEQQDEQHADSDDDAEEDEEDDDEDLVLRQALALSLVEQTPSIRVNTSSSEAAYVAPSESLSSGPVTPGAETPTSVKEAPISEPNDSPLPKLPTPPKFYPFTSMLNSDHDDEPLFLDPAALHRFGTVPTQHVLVHLLRYTLERIERRKFQAWEESPSPRKNISTISGGIGSSLFPPTLRKPKANDQGSDAPVSLQLLVALFLLSVDKRNDAMENLRKALAQERRAATDGEEGQDASSPSEEGDDPAIALALNNIDDEISESLQAKGMRRKAAAAAHDAAALTKSLRRRTDAWKQRVKLFSQSALVSMKCLRLFLQSVVRQWLQERRGLSAIDCHDFLPTAVASKLSMCLAALTSVSTKSSLNLLPDETDELLMPLRLYQEAQLLWGESVPLVYPSVGAQVEILRSLLAECSKSSAQIRSLGSLSSPPTSESEPNFHRLQMVCRRLRVSDLLDSFVSSPACYLPDADENDEMNKEANKEALMSSSEPCRASSVIAMIRSSSKGLRGIKGELQHFFLALCHRIHLRILLWDGLFAYTEPETDETAVSLTPSPADYVRVGSTPSSTLQLDATKCSDSIAIISNNENSPSITPIGSSAHQRASKVWGTVLSSACYSPKTGVHRWAVRLDKCERGHVFVGVATAQASMRTYVGGDKYGWGMIGTQAIWHDRRKIRGDYGSTFRTGSTIIVTLDTDAGTLSFSSWKDSNSSSSFSLDPLVQNLSSPRRQGHVGGTIEEWGVAFEGLPLDSRLYPAVGLYQRDDRVTLLTVESGGRATLRNSSIDVSGGLCYYPRISMAEESLNAEAQLAQVRKFNDQLSWDGIDYASKALEDVVDCIREGRDDFLLTMLLPSLASSLCLVPPTIPILSQRCALTLLPYLTRCVRELERCRAERPMVHRLFRTGLQDGKWTIRATGSSGSSSDSEEYLVDFSLTANEHGSAIGFEGSGVGTTGKSKNGLVAIFGTLKGSSVHFVEEWTDGSDDGFTSATTDDSASSCVVNARLSLDGTKFEGTYRNVQFGTTGQIAGFLCSDKNSISKFRLKDAPASEQSAELTGAVVTGEGLLCLSHSHMATIVGEDAAGDLSYDHNKPADSPLKDAEWPSHRSLLKQCLSLPVISGMSVTSHREALAKHLDSLKALFAPPSSVRSDAVGHLSLLNSSSFQDEFGPSDTRMDERSFLPEVEIQVAKLDEEVCGLVGGKGSLSTLNAPTYLSTRQSLICSLLYHCGLSEVVRSAADADSIPTQLLSVWRTASRILEDGVRNALSAGKREISSREKCATLCHLYDRICSFLLSLERSGESDSTFDEVATTFSLLFSTIKCEGDLEYLGAEMSRSTKRAMMRLIAMHEMITLLSDSSGLPAVDSPVAIESLTIGIPRLLGRGYSERVRKHDSQRSSGQVEDLGGHYLTGISGSGILLKRALRKNAHEMLHILVRVVERAMTRRKEDNSSESIVSIDSMILSLLGTFIIVLRAEEVDELVRSTPLLSIITQILNEHRHAVLGNFLDPGDHEDEKAGSVVKDLYKISHREVSRSVLRAAVAVAHVTLYQASAPSNSRSAEPITLSRSSDFLLDELTATLPLIEAAVVETLSENEKKCANNQWDNWCDLGIQSESPTTPTKLKVQREQVGKSGVKYLEEHGTTQINGVQASSQKQSSRSRGIPNSSPRSGTENLIKLQGNFCHQYLSHWLHIFVAVSRDPAVLANMAADIRWTKLLLRSVGLSAEFGSTNNIVKVQVREQGEGLLPGRYRSRIIRSLLPLLDAMTPCKEIVRGLFCLAGATSPSLSRTMDEDEGTVSREAVSLLRQLHSPSRCGWRQCINREVTMLSSTPSKDSESMPIKIGALCFFNGNVDVISRGSFVLLKPASAVPLSVDQQSTPNSKGHSSSVGGGSGSGIGSTPHHIVGSGTGGIVSGLCRADASAGIVSSVDMQIGVCEVILLTRNRGAFEGADEDDDNSRARPAVSSGKGSHSSKHTLTVRALRSPLADVVQAQEVPIYLDESIGVEKLVRTALEDALRIFSAARFDSPLNVRYKSTGETPTEMEVASEEVKSEPGGDETEMNITEMRSKIIDVASAVLAVRSSIVILSDVKILMQFLKESNSRELLSAVLELACPDDKPAEAKQDYAQGAQKKFLSSLPVHEAKWVHLVALFRDLRLREQILLATPESLWNKRFTEYRSKQSEMIHLETASTPRLGGQAGSISQAVDSSFVAEAPPVSTNSGNSERGMSRTADSNLNHGILQSSAGSDNSEDDDSEAATTAAAHLREAAIAQMAELGLPRSWSELALRRTGGTNIEAAVHFCLERGGEMERLLAEERERESMMQRQSSSGSSGRRRADRSESGTSNHLLRQLLEMGFPSRWCAEALAANGNNVDAALTWILTNGERLSAEDEGMEEDGDEEDIDDDDEEEDSQDDDETSDGRAASDTVVKVDAGLESGDNATSRATKQEVAGTVESSDRPGWSGSAIPLRFISGRSMIDPRTLAISGLPTGGFSSVGTKGIMLTSGKWYYEAILETAGCLQIGWADGSFAGHCHADRGDGCGDGPSSWAYDGWRRYRWHATATEWGCRWKEGDVVGCLVDMDDPKSISFTLNGRAEDVGMGVAFSGNGFRPCGGVYACVSFNRREKLRLILGGSGSEPFKYPPPPGYYGVGEAVLQAVEERDILILKESPLDQSFSTDMQSSSLVKDLDENCDESKRFLCDFSDGEHGHELMAWAHRYYGSDASVHLGSGRMKQSSGISKRLSSSSSVDSSPSSCLSRRVEKVWSKMREGKGPTPEDASNEALSVSMMKCGYTEVGLQIAQEIFRESMAMASLLARKLILHIVVSMGEDFDPDCFFRSVNPDLLGALRFWKVVEASSSLRCAGWVGEAGAMALAAEALGLGISSNDHTNSRHASSERSSVASLSDLDDGLLVPAGGITQLLSSVLEWDMQTDARSSGNSLAACAEAAIGSDGGGGVLVFLLKGLQGAACRSEPFRRIIIAAIRRTVRLLAVVEYDGDDSASAEVGGDEDDDTGRKLSSLDRSLTSRKEDESEEKDTSAHADARLASYLTGLLLSKPVETAVGDLREIEEELFEVWSVGMLSASLPWRMICAFTAAGILNRRPSALRRVVDCFPTIARFYGRLQGTVVRRVWAERAAVPVCSRYVQSMIELLTSVKRAVDGNSFSDTFLKAWNTASVDAATPLPLGLLPGSVSNWEADEGWLSSDCGWEVWTGTVEYMAVDWKTPSRSAVRTLMDGGDGPPMLREGCTVMRGLDWDEDSNYDNEDGKNIYEAGKAERDSEKRASEETFDEDPVNASEAAGPIGSYDAPKQPLAGPTDEVHENPASITAVPGADTADEDNASENASAKKKKRKKVPSPKLPLGTVISIEPWNGIPAMGRRVRWHLTGKEGVYRYGGDGGRYDISHIEVNEKATRVRKRHPLPESAEQCAARHGFGAKRRHNVLLRLRRNGAKNNFNGTAENHRQAILEWPDFGAGILADCTLHSDGAVTLRERELIFGSKDSGWEARFGQPSFVPGTVVNLRSTESSSSKTQAEVDSMSPYQSFYDELVGSNSFDVQYLRNRENGSTLQVTSEMRLFRGKALVSDQGADASSTSIQAPLPPPIHFDRDYHASSLSLSRDGRTVSCVSSDGRGTAFASIGFTKGVHYWEVKLEQADIGSVFIGVAEKPSGSGGSGSSFGYDSPPRLNRWHGWGFVNFRATYTAGAERVYGAHCHAGDTVGVMLDCDAGRISFFFDGLKYGEHILNDLGCAFENISPFGFNVDGCGSGGAGQGAPSGIEGGRGGRYPAQGSVRPRALWPIVGLRNHGDRVTISSKWSTSYGVDGLFTLRNVLAVDELLNRYSKTGGNIAPSESPERSTPFPEWFVREAFFEYQRWQSGSWCRSATRGSGPYDLTCFGPDLELDSSPFACASACAMLGLNHALLAGDRVRLKRSAGRILELAEEAVVLGIYQGRLFYRIVSQKSEGGSLTEGGGRAWCWDESEVVDGLPPLTSAKGLGIELSLLDRFKCTSSGGLRVVYEGGAVVRSDLEIFDGSINLGSIPVNTVLAQRDVLERRVNSCGVVRYRVRYDAVGEGWISSCIRGGKEEAIVMPVHHSLSGGEDQGPSFSTPHQCAVEWLEKYNRAFLIQGLNSTFAKDTTIEDCKTFESLVASGVIPGLSIAASDSLLTSMLGAISAYSEEGDEVDASFKEIASAISFALASKSGQTISESHGSPGANQAAATALAGLETTLPPLRSILARVAVIRSFNKRARLALPWLPLRPSQEGAAILGGLNGHGASIDRAGRNRLPESQSQWLQVPSIASNIRSVRGLFFTGVKRGLLQSITEATTTPTPLSHDEYELPREIRTVRINRLKARRALSGNDVAMQRKHSVFAQLHNETKGWGGAALRRGFVAKGHGGQKRSFKVKLIGEGVNDYSGPYREAFTDAMNEILNVDKSSRGSLGVLDPTPNNSSEIGENRDLFMFSLNGQDLSGLMKNNAYLSPEEHRIRESFSSLTTVRDETSREVEEALVFLGRMTGTAFRHGIPLDLPLPMESVWKAMAEEPSMNETRLNELDCLAQRQRGVDGITNLPPILWWQQRMLNSFVEGLSNVLPVEVLTIFTGEELRDIFCGNPEVDVDLLRRVVEYEGYNESDDVIQYFWETLRELTNDERKTFLQFVWARNRLPTKESDFDAPFKIQRDGSNNRGDNALPSASTCFFSLALPEYSSKEVLKHKLLFAINNVTTMETDFQTNSAEIAEGYRAF